MKCYSCEESEFCEYEQCVNCSNTLCDECSYSKCEVCKRTLCEDCDVFECARNFPGYEFFHICNDCTLTLRVCRNDESGVPIFYLVQNIRDEEFFEVYLDVYQTWFEGGTSLLQNKSAIIENRESYSNLEEIERNTIEHLTESEYLFIHDPGPLRVLFYCVSKLLSLCARTRERMYKPGGVGYFRALQDHVPQCADNLNEIVAFQAQDTESRRVNARTRKLEKTYGRSVVAKYMSFDDNIMVYLKCRKKHYDNLRNALRKARIEYYGIRSIRSSKKVEYPSNVSIVSQYFKENPLHIRVPYTILLNRIEYASIVSIVCTYFELNPFKLPFNRLRDRKCVCVNTPALDCPFALCARDCKSSSCARHYKSSSCAPARKRIKLN
jgi:hypothetical protein